MPETKRIEAHLTLEMHDAVLRAAARKGLSIAAFLRLCVVERAEEILRDSEGAA